MNYLYLSESALSADKIVEQREEDMETEDVLSLPNTLSYSKTETTLQDTNINELERRRAEIIEELNEVETHNSEKSNQRIKEMEKKKSAKKSHSSSKSHKSIMFSSEDSNNFIQRADNIQSFKKANDASENIFKSTPVTSCSSNKLPSYTNSSFFKFGPSSSSKAFDLPYASKTSSLTVSSSSTSNVFGQSSLPTSSLPTASFQQPQVKFCFPKLCQVFFFLPQTKTLSSSFVLKIETILPVVVFIW